MSLGGAGAAPLLAPAGVDPGSAAAPAPVRARPRGPRRRLRAAAAGGLRRARGGALLHAGEAAVLAARHARPRQAQPARASRCRRTRRRSSRSGRRSSRSTARRCARRGRSTTRSRGRCRRSRACRARSAGPACNSSRSAAFAGLELRRVVQLVHRRGLGLRARRVQQRVHRGAARLVRALHRRQVDVGLHVVAGEEQVRDLGPRRAGASPTCRPCSRAAARRSSCAGAARPLDRRVEVPRVDHVVGEDRSPLSFRCSLICSNTSPRPASRVQRFAGLP